MSEQLTNGDLERIEAKARIARDEPDSIENAYIVNTAPELVLRLVAALREAWSEIDEIRNPKHKHKWVAMKDKAWNYRKCQECGETEAY